ncbi:FAD binding domain-containing protein [Apiospora kogelbergensis]|uniref:FAD binding domain-containing protein n=1 Tax=Apiospora kogelbergensis TaxID=1337665 RepID=A0AAW0QFC2_9PEZI
MERPFKKVIVVGAGPSGLLLSLLLAQHGIPVHIVEGADQLDGRPRAAIYGPAAMPDLARAGVLAEIRRRGFTVNTMSWRRFADHAFLTGMDGRVVADVDGRDLRIACLVLDELDRLLLDEFLTKHKGEISWEHRVVGVGQDGESAWVDVETPEGRKTMHADYIVGCDGATSMVRKSLFPDFPGFTWDRQIIATNIYYDFEGTHGFTNTNFIMHPEHFCMVAKITKDGLYRVTYGEPGGLTLDEIKERQPMKFETMLPGHPKPGDYELVSLAPYKMHQRCAPSFRVGRVLLAADAAHLCNPWGGMGITGGFVDAGGLADCLIGMWDGVADESILDLYSEKRRAVWRDIIDPQSQDNFRRVSDPDPDTLLERDAVMKACKAAEGDEEMQRQAFLGMMNLRYDFTQHYNKK